MILRQRKPGDLTEAERLAEIADILAAGYLRLVTSRGCAQDSLDDSAPAEPPCGLKALNPKTKE